MDTKKLEKIEYYQALARELRKIWNLKVRVVPLVSLVIGAEIGIESQTTELQKTTQLESSKRLLRFEETCCYCTSRT